MRPIDADEVLPKIDECLLSSMSRREAIITCYFAVKEAPTIDTQPVKHGQWIHVGGGYDGRDDWYRCSECNRSLNLICGKKLEDYPYCHCGAKMDLEEKKNEKNSNNL